MSPWLSCHFLGWGWGGEDENGEEEEGVGRGEGGKVELGGGILWVSDNRGWSYCNNYTIHFLGYNVNFNLVLTKLNLNEKYFWIYFHKINLFSSNFGKNILIW